jgi:hypothetical protein
MPKWLQILEQYGPNVLLFTPAAPLAPFVLAGIHVAHQIPGATGPQKKALATQIATLSAQAADVAAGRPVVDPAAVADATSSAIDAVVKTVNIIHDAKAPAPPVAP